jgi:hypothetical protein
MVVLARDQVAQDVGALARLSAAMRVDRQVALPCRRPCLFQSVSPWWM